jgi:hypothetical protein
LRYSSVGSLTPSPKAQVVVVDSEVYAGIVVFESHDQLVTVQLGRPRTLDLKDLHLGQEKIESPDKGVNGEPICANSKLTCEGDGLERSRSCCNVLSTVVCFWKFCSGFDGPHMPSAMANDLYLSVSQSCRSDLFVLKAKYLSRRAEVTHCFGIIVN